VDRSVATPVREPSEIVLAEWPNDQSDAPPVASTADDPFRDESELRLEQLTAEVIRRNPTLAVATAAWRAAAERYPQMIALDDPMFGFMLGPATFNSGSVDTGWMLEASQKVPWPGKRELRGAMAAAEADVMGHDIRDTHLKLSEAAAIALLDYFVARRELDLNAENTSRTQKLRNTAKNHLEAGRVRVQDVKDANVELGMLTQRQIELERQFRVAAARINTLLHRAPSHPLPPPPATLDESSERNEWPAADALRKLALDRRPDLAAQADRIRQQEIAVALAAKEFWPDFEFVARYDAFWQPDERDLRPQIGMSLNLPLQRERRRAALREAIAQVERQRAEFDSRVANIQLEVETAVAELSAANASRANYSQIISDAEASLESAQAAYETAGVDFLRLIESQRKLIANREKQVEAEANYHRRRAELERIIGGPLDNANSTPGSAWRRAH
jgi:outer membrane protein TolC